MNEPTEDPIAIYGEKSESNPKVIYMVKQFSLGFTCECKHFVTKGWRNGTCKHIEKVKARIKYVQQ